MHAHILQYTLYKYPSILIIVKGANYPNYALVSITPRCTCQIVQRRMTRFITFLQVSEVLGKLQYDQESSKYIAFQTIEILIENVQKSSPKYSENAVCSFSAKGFWSLIKWGTGPSPHTGRGPLAALPYQTHKIIIFSHLIWEKIKTINITQTLLLLFFILGD